MTRTSQISHIPTIAYAKMHGAMFEMMRGDFARAAELAGALVDFTREHELKLFGAFAVFLDGWTAWRAGDPVRGRAEMRRGFTVLQEQNSVIFDGVLKTAFANAQAQAGDYAGALATLELATLESGRSGQHWFDAELYRTRGKILLKQDPSGFVQAEEAFLAAIAIAQGQKARSFELRAALSLARLYRASGRSTDAHGVLSPALAGFSPRPDFPEIEAAQCFFASLDTLFGRPANLSATIGIAPSNGWFRSLSMKGDARTVALRPLPRFALEVPRSENLKSVRTVRYAGRLMPSRLICR